MCFIVVTFLCFMPHKRVSPVIYKLGMEVLYVVILLLHYYIISSVTRKKSPNVYEGCPKMIALEK